MKVKLFALMLVSGGLLMALGISCIPNIAIRSPLAGLLGG
jgi:hypothetical protein